MKESNPSVDPSKITRENGMNKATEKGTALNNAGIDWFAFQEALGKQGYMGIVDIEGPQTGSESFKSETIMDGKNLLGIGLMLTIGGLVISRMFTMRRSIFGAEVIDDFGAECQGYHFD